MQMRIVRFITHAPDWKVQTWEQVAHNHAELFFAKEQQAVEVFLKTLDPIEYILLITPTLEGCLLLDAGDSLQSKLQALHQPHEVLVAEHSSSIYAGLAQTVLRFFQTYDLTMPREDGTVVARLDELHRLPVLDLNAKHIFGKHDSPLAIVTIPNDFHYAQTVQRLFFNVPLYRKWIPSVTNKRNPLLITTIACCALFIICLVWKFYARKP